MSVTKPLYAPGTGARILNSSKKAISAAEERQPGTLSLALYLDPRDGDEFRLAGANESQEYCINVH